MLLFTSLVVGAGCRSSHLSVRASFDDNHEVRETTQKQFKAGRVNTLEVSSNTGDITVSVGDSQEEITVKAEKTLSGNGSESSLRETIKHLKAFAYLKDSTLFVETKSDTEAATKGSIHYTITVPRRLSAVLKSSSGDIKASGLAGSVSATTSTGGATLSQLSGSVSVESASGDIKLKQLAGCPIVKASSKSGSINAEEIAVTNYEAEGVSGDNEFDGKASDLKLKSVTGEVKLTLSPGSAVKEANAESVSGSVSASFPKETKGTLFFSTVTGEVDTSDMGDRREQDREKHELTLPLNGGGGANIRLKAISGDLKAELQK